MLFGIMGLFIVLNTVMAAWLLALWCNAQTGYPRAIVSGVRLGRCMLLAEGNLPVLTLRLQNLPKSLQRDNGKSRAQFHGTGRNVGEV